LTSSLPQLGATNLVLNGGFESNGGLGELGNNTAGTTTVGTWTVGPTVFNSVTPNPGTTAPFDFIMNNTASTTGTRSLFGHVYLEGSVPASPDGGFFLGADGGYAVAPISQAISGLAPNTTYQLSFYWAASQLTICDAFGDPCKGNTVDDWKVTVDGQTFYSAPLPGYNETFGTFGGWMDYSTTFTTGSSISSNLLTFLAGGTPIGEPPFLLLDGVTLTPVSATSSVPEPGPVALLAGGVLSLIGAVRLRRRRK
jgi:hypothetical protein